ncbi:TPA: cysteine--tRNA ligase [Candidatus Woesearchaeota archaeon]|nr:cysteine--tRNA ligase [Candidatus Woesearchaeota archaeon]
MLKLFNTMTRRKEVFKPIKPGFVGIYTCGPTIYNFAHIGNYRAYIFEDQLKRYLKYRDFDVKQVMNLTDVDDKTIRDSQKEGIKLKDFTDRYGKAFFEDIDALNIDKAEVFPAATEHINEMIDLIKRLLEKGYAYRGEDGSIYYSIARFKDYGKLSHIDVSGLKAGARVKQDEYDKEHVSDFVLWKAYDQADGDVFWETELGKGRPGWHIECSAMSMKYLGEHFDIHTGGVDNMFPHHENEIAQSEAATGKTFVNYWLHCAHLIVDGKKMSKSLGNFYTLRDVFSRGYKARAVRYLLLSTHYRQQLNFTFEGVDAADTALEKIISFKRRLEEIKEKGADVDKKTDKKTADIIKKAKHDFEAAMDDDLNISVALSAVFDMMKDANTLIMEASLGSADAEAFIEAVKKFDEVIGVLAYDKKEELDEELQALIKKREEARKNKNWKEADRIRTLLKEKGILLDDTKEGVRWKRSSI